MIGYDTLSSASHMDPLMHFEHVRLPEFLPTLRALKRLVPCMDLHVSFEPTGREEAFAALRAGVGTHSGVVAGVQLEVAGLREALVAVRALEGLVSRVIALVLQ